MEEPTPTEMTRALAQAATNGKDTRLTVIVVVVIFLLQLVGGFQRVHNWPPTVVDTSYVVGFAACGFFWAKIYRRHGG